MRRHTGTTLIGVARNIDNTKQVILMGDDVNVVGLDGDDCQFIENTKSDCDICTQL